MYGNTSLSISARQHSASMLSFSSSAISTHSPVIIIFTNNYFHQLWETTGIASLRMNGEPSPTLEYAFIMCAGSSLYVVGSFYLIFWQRQHCLAKSGQTQFLYLFLAWLTTQR